MTVPILSGSSALYPLGLTRDEKHVYSWNDGHAVWHPFPSVTQAIKLIDKSGPLVGWAKRETAASAIRNLDALLTMRKEGGPEAAVEWLKRIPDYQRDRAADRGTAIHAIADQIVRGQAPEIPEELGPYVASYHAFLAEWTPKVIASEQMVCSLKHGYAGTFDLIAEIDGERWLLDLKTGGAYFETALQLAAYGAAEFIGRPGDPKKYRVPRATRFGVVHVQADGSPSKLVPYAVDRGDFAVFLKCLEVWTWTQTKGKTVIQKPLNKEKAGAA